MSRSTDDFKNNLQHIKVYSSISIQYKTHNWNVFGDGLYISLAF